MATYITPARNKVRETVLHRHESLLVSDPPDGDWNSLFGSDSHAVSTPFILRMYLYWMSLDAGTATVTASTSQHAPHARRGIKRTAPCGVVRRREDQRVVWGPVFQGVDVPRDIDVLCGIHVQC